MSPNKTEQASVQLHREKFPALNGKAYFNFGGQGTMSQATLDAIRNAYLFVQKEGPFSAKTLGWIGEEGNRTKESLASELGGALDSYALTQNATEGCNIVLWGIEWQPGDHLVTTDAEHPGVEAAVRKVAARRDLRVTSVPLSNLSLTSTTEEIVALFRNAFEPRTKLVVLSHVLWNTGRALPLREIQAACRDAGVQLLVDGAQSAGVIPLDFSKEPIDYFAITGHKWMGGPEGVGALFIHPDLIEKLEPTFVGWRSAMYASENVNETASRFEVATAPFPLWSGLRAAIDVHREWGTPHERYEQLLSNVSMLKTMLNDLGSIQIVTPENAPSGLVSFAVKGNTSHQTIAAKLEEKRIFLRTIPLPDCVRASVHYFTNAEDARLLCDSLRQFISST